MPDADRLDRATTAALAALVAGSLLAPAALAAQAPGRAAVGEPIRVAVQTEDVYTGFAPRAVVRLSAPAHVAVFEVEPDVGAVLLFPHAASTSRRLAAGTHAFRLNGPRMAHLREQLLWRMGPRLRARTGVHPDAHLVALASRRPLRLDRLRGGRVFVYRPADGFAARGSVGEVAAELLAAVLPRSTRRSGAWDHDHHAYGKARSPGLAATFGHGPSILADAAASGCFLPRDPWSAWWGFPAVHRGGGFAFFRPGWGFGFAGPLAGHAGAYLAVSATPISPGLCRTFGYELRRFGGGFGRSPWWRPIFTGPFDPRRDRTPAAESGKEGPGASLPGDEPEGREPVVGGEAGAPPAVPAALLERIADARSPNGISRRTLSELARREGIAFPATRRWERTRDRKRVRWPFRLDRTTRAWHPRSGWSASGRRGSSVFGTAAGGRGGVFGAVPGARRGSSGRVRGQGVRVRLPRPPDGE